MKWTAFLRLTGETQATNKTQMRSEFVRLVQLLQRLNAECNLILFVEAEGSRVVQPLISEKSFEEWARREESDI